MLGYEMIRLQDRCYKLWLRNVQVTTYVATIENALTFKIEHLQNYLVTVKKQILLV